jgi:hypothetical protein
VKVVAMAIVVVVPGSHLLLCSTHSSHSAPFSIQLLQQAEHTLHLVIGDSLHTLPDGLVRLLVVVDVPTLVVLLVVTVVTYSVLVEVVEGRWVVVLTFAKMISSTFSLFLVVLLHTLQTEENICALSTFWLQVSYPLHSPEKSL